MPRTSLNRILNEERRFFICWFGLRWNFINRFRTHEVLAAGWLHNFFFNTQTVEQQQHLKERSRVIIFNISGARSWRRDKMQECVKLQFPFDRKPTLKNRNNLT